VPSIAKFTLEDDPESDPSSSPASTSPERLLELDFTSPDKPASSSRPPHRRWTLAMAMTDEGMTDEALVEALERIRIQRDSSDSDTSSAVWDVNQDTWNWNLQWDKEGIDDTTRELGIPHTTSLPTFPLHHSLSVPSSPKFAAAWHTARQALLTCRELVRTERHYLSSLTLLIASETATLPPPLMIHYASQLAAVSQRFLTHLEADPSALGVAAAFLGVEEPLEGAFVGWCGVVGIWFEAPSSPMIPKRRLSKGRSEEDIPEFGASAAHTGNGYIRRNGNSWRRNVPTMTSLNESTATLSQGLTPSFSYSFLNWRRDRSGNGPSTNGNTKKPPVRDLAILPTQRVLRYVLIYRGQFQRIFATRLFHINRDRSAGTYPCNITITGLGRKGPRSDHTHCAKMRPRSRQLCFSQKTSDRAFV
jgi:hypothetical protein